MKRQRRLGAVELALAAWIALWVLMGYAVNREVHGIARLGGTVVLAGRSIEQTADALDAARALPIVGGGVARLAATARATARSAIANGQVARKDVDHLAALLWLTVAAAPTLPAIAWYVWARRPLNRAG